MHFEINYVQKRGQQLSQDIAGARETNVKKVNAGQIFIQLVRFGLCRFNLSRDDAGAEDAAAEDDADAEI